MKEAKREREKKNGEKRKQASKQSKGSTNKIWRPGGKEDRQAGGRGRERDFACEKFPRATTTGTNESKKTEKCTSSAGKKKKVTQKRSSTQIRHKINLR